MCSRCRIEKPEAEYSKSRAGKDGVQAYCRQCQREKYRMRIDSLSPEEDKIRRKKANTAAKRWYHKNKKLKRTPSGPKPGDFIVSRHIAMNLLYSVKRRCAKHSRTCNLTIEWIEEKIKKGHCERSGIAFDLSISRSHLPFAPSLDRIDNKGGYTMSNVQLVCSMYNLGKNRHADDDFIWFCKQVAKFN